MVQNALKRHHEAISRQCHRQKALPVQYKLANAYGFCGLENRFLVNP